MDKIQVAANTQLLKGQPLRSAFQHGINHIPRQSMAAGKHWTWHCPTDMTRMHSLQRALVDCYGYCMSGALSGIVT